MRRALLRTVPNSNEIVLRNVEADDLDAVAHLIELALDGLKILTPEQRVAFLDNALKNTKWALEPGHSSVHLAASFRSSVIGVVLIKNCWNLCNLFVLPAFQHQGIGQLLLRRAVREAQRRDSARDIELRTVASVTPFYKKLGFEAGENVGPLDTIPMKLGRPC